MQDLACPLFHDGFPKRGCFARASSPDTSADRAFADLATSLLILAEAAAAADAVAIAAVAAAWSTSATDCVAGVGARAAIAGVGACTVSNAVTGCCSTPDTAFMSFENPSWPICAMVGSASKLVHCWWMCC